MKKLILLILLLVVFFSISSALAGEKKVMEKNSKTEEIREQPASEWQVIIFTPEQSLAFNKPGVEQLIPLSSGKIERTNFWHYILIQEYKQTIVFRGNKFETLDHAGKKDSEEKLAIYVIFLLMAGLCMLISNVFKRQSIKVACAVATTFVTWVSVISVGNTDFDLTATASVIAIIAATIAAYDIIKGNDREYKIASVIFYIAAFVVVCPF